MTTKGLVVDHCCPPGVTNDRDCPQPYPFTQSYAMAATTGSSVLTWGGDPSNPPSLGPQIYVPLQPATCGPVVMTADLTGSAWPSYSATSDFGAGVWYSRAGTSSTMVAVDASDGPVNPTLVTVDDANAVVTGAYQWEGCHVSPCSVKLQSSDATINLSFAEFRPDVIVAAPVAPEAPRISGDASLSVVAYRDVAAGIGGVFAVGGHFAASSGRTFLGQTQWVEDFASKPLSTPGVDARPPALTHGADIGTTKGHTHVVWVEGGTSLRYAQLDDAGGIVVARELRAGTGLHHPDIAAVSATSFPVLFVESVSGVDRLRIVVLDDTGASVGSLIDVTSGEGQASDPFLSPPRKLGDPASVAWIDARSGAPQVLHQLLDATTLAPSGTPTVVDPAAVNPTHPQILPRTSNEYVIVWSDERDGLARVYGRRLGAGQNGTGTVSLDARSATEPNLTRIRPGGPVPGETPNGLVGLSWTRGGGGDTVRYGHLAWSFSTPTVPALQGGEVSLACQGVNTSSLSLFEAGVYYVHRHYTLPEPRALLHGVWIQNGQIVAKQIPNTTSRTPLRCTPNALLCTNSQELAKCGDDGFSTSRVLLCPWSEHCDAVRGACACTPGPACTGTVATVCNADGTYAAGGTDCAAQGATCVFGQCRSPALSDGFEDGAYDGWLPSSVKCTRQVVTTQAANGTAHSLVQSNCLGSRLSRDLGGITPTHLGFWMRADATNGSWLMIESAEGLAADIELGLSSGKLTNFVATGVAASPNTWYHVELRNISWAAHTYELFVNDVRAAYGSFTTASTSWRRIQLVSGLGNTWWDEFTAD